MKCLSALLQKQLLDKMKTKSNTRQFFNIFIYDKNDVMLFRVITEKSYWGKLSKHFHETDEAHILVINIQVIPVPAGWPSRTHSANREKFVSLTRPAPY